MSRIARLHCRYADAHVKIALYKKGQLQLAPGCNPEQTLEAEVTGILNNIREIAGERPLPHMYTYFCCIPTCTAVLHAELLPHCLL